MSCGCWLYIFVWYSVFECVLQDDIIKAVEKVCSLLQGNDQSECKTLVDSFGPQIIKLLVQQLSPQMICPKLNLCPKNPTVKVNILSGK